MLIYAFVSESEESDDGTVGEEGVGSINKGHWFFLDEGQLFLLRALRVKPSRMGSCCARAVVQVK